MSTARLFSSLWALSLLAALLLPLAARPAPARVQAAFLRWASYVSWDPRSFQALQAHLGDLDVVASHTASLRQDGTLDDATEPQVRDLLAGFGGRALLEVTNAGFDQDAAHAILTDPPTRERALASLAALGRPWAGVVLDFEDLAPADRDAYSSFVRDAKARLGPNRTLAVAVAAQTKDTHAGWAGGFDYTALGQAADLVFLMGYGFRTGRSASTGPVAPLPWLQDVLDFAVTRIPSARLVLGLPSYGFDWRTDPLPDDPTTPQNEADAPRGQSVTYADALALEQAHNIPAPSYDWERSGTMLRYQDDAGVKHEVWYEDRLTLDQKLALVGRYRLAGVGWWRLGGEDPGVWGALKARALGGRFFLETGYTVSLLPFLDLFDHRGGVRTFGYPISNEFLLLGSQVQLFQRAALQLGPDGSVRLMNLLDPEMLPLLHLNGSTLPAPDPALIRQAPSPTMPEFGALAPTWVRQVAPESWEGLPVGFGRTFFGTVTCADAFGPGPCNEGLLPLMDLELWGLPTSQPARDPGNANFVYQRFQRGVLQFDAASGTTQWLLLGDVLKSVLTGQNLPPDVEQEQRGSRFFRQYDPSRPGALARPEQLPASDLRGAFQ